MKDANLPFPLLLFYFILSYISIPFSLLLEIICLISTCKWPARIKRNQSAASQLKAGLKHNGWNVSGCIWQKIAVRGKNTFIFNSPVVKYALSSLQLNKRLRKHTCLLYSELNTSLWASCLLTKFSSWFHYFYVFWNKLDLFQKRKEFCVRCTSRKTFYL